MRVLTGPLFAFLLIVTLSLISLAAIAQWVEDGAPICSAVEDQLVPKIVSDGAGGALMVWQDGRNDPDNPDIYAQRVDVNGEPLWTANGAQVCTAAGDQLYPEIVSDGVGGAIIVWIDWRAGFADIYAQRVDGAGSVKWAANGVPVTTASLHQKVLAVAPDDSGGVLVAWEDSRSSFTDIYAQRIDSTGAAKWTPNGVAICTAADYQRTPDITSDGGGGAIVAWSDLRNASYYDAYAQRVGASGTIQWQADGVLLSTLAAQKRDVQLIGDGAGGALATWGADDIYAQYFTGSGSLLWGNGGLALCLAAGPQEYPKIATDGSGGAIIAWEDGRAGNKDVYAQRVGAGGSLYWITNGVPVCAAASDQSEPAIAANGSNGAVVVWTDSRTGDMDIYGQMLDSSGSPAWQEDGLRLCGAQGDQSNAVLSVDPGEFLETVWTDGRTGDADIYALLVGFEGQMGLRPVIEAVPDVPNDDGGAVSVRWFRSAADWPPYATITHYSVWRSITPDAASALKDSGALTAFPADVHAGFSGPVYRETFVDGSSYAWEWLADAPAHYLPEYAYTAATLFDSTGAGPGYHWFMVSAHTSDPFIFYDSVPDSGYSVDNLPPAIPKGLVAEIVGECDLYISWMPNVEPDFSNYSIYRGEDPDFTPEPGNRIAKLYYTSYVDEDYGYSVEYYYKISACDVNGNESAFALLTPCETAGVPGSGASHMNALHQNAPNPFAGSTHIAFSIERAGPVRLDIFDATGRHVRALVNENRVPNRYVEQWNGRDARGRLLPCGAYFYRIETTGWNAVKKLTLAR